MPNPWISNRVKQKWGRLLFSLAAGTFMWWHIQETLVTTRLFTDVPIYVYDLPPGKTINGLRQDGRLIRPFNINLRGRKQALESIAPDQIELLVQASGKGEVWKEVVTVDSLRCLNPQVQITRDLLSIEHPPLQLRLTSKASRDIPVTVLPPSGTLPKGYKLISIWPDQLTQTVEGPEEAVQILAIRRLFLTFDLGRVGKQALDRLSEESPPASEIFFKVPDSWKQVSLPGPFEESKLIQDPEGENMVMVILKSTQLPIESPILIRVSPLPPPLATTPFINTQLKVIPEPGHIGMIDGFAHWVRPIYMEGVSHDFAEVITPHLEFVIYVGTKGTIEGQIEVANPQRAEVKYIERMMQSHFDTLTLSEEQLQAQLSQQFWTYLSQLTFCGSLHQRLKWDFTVVEKQLRIRESA